MGLRNIDIIMKLVRKEVMKYEIPVIERIDARYNNPFHVLISCLLSLRTRDSTTEKASERLFKLANSPRTMLCLSIKQIEKAIYPVGFYRTKAERIKDICKVILEQYNGKVPDSMEELLKLKGVGRKTANIVLLHGFGKQALPIDTHCHRIPNRIGLVKTKTPEETETALRKELPRKYWKEFNMNFVLFGQNICKPVGPMCQRCPVLAYCYYGMQRIKNSEK